MIRKVNIIGYVGSEVELKEAKSGISYIIISIATSDRKSEEPIWFNVTVFGAFATTLQGFIKKGSLVYASGNITGTTTSGSINLIADTVQVLKSKKNTESDPTGDNNGQSVDKLPF